MFLASRNQMVLEHGWQLQLHLHLMVIPCEIYRGDAMASIAPTAPEIALISLVTHKP